MSKQPYSYTVLRYVHDTGTGKFANVNVANLAFIAFMANMALTRSGIWRNVDLP